MPELPEVERARTIAESALKGHRIKTVAVADDRIVFDRAARRAVAAALRGRRVVATWRRGKYFWLELDRRPWPVLHLGMSGSVRVLAPGDKPPTHWKLELTTDAGTRFVLRDPRRFGRVRLAQDPAVEPPVSRLGFDPLLEMPPPKVFAALLHGRGATIKGVLLDQSFAAGVGNWIADEVLYQARIAPTRRASDLSAAEAGKLRNALRRVIAHAVKVGADYHHFPEAWLFHHRWGKRAGAATHSGQKIVHQTIAGRTTAWVPEWQK